MPSVLAGLTHAFGRYLHGLSPRFGNQRYKIGQRAPWTFSHPRPLTPLHRSLRL